MSVKDEVQDVVEKGIEYSKTSMKKAWDAVSRFGDESVLRIEIKRLEKKRDILKTELGQLVYSKFDESKKKTVSRNAPEISVILKSIDSVKQEIESRKKQLNVPER